VTLPAPDPEELVAQPQLAEEAEPAATTTRGIPGWLVVSIATLVVIAVAVAEVLVEDRIGLWTGITLVCAAVIAPLVTRHGDRSLPAMMPPLAFLAAVLVAGQALVAPTGGSWRTREAVMLIETLGANAAWVVAATVASVTLATIGHLIDRHRSRRAL
jgi:Domain of unknown function (DUF6542)